MSDKMSIDQKEPSQENTPAESKASSPDHEHSPSAPSQEAQPAKRKGGRKPVRGGVLFCQRDALASRSYPHITSRQMAVE